MINNKNQLKNAINKNRVAYIKRIYNLDMNNKIKEGTIATITSKQSNAFTIKWENYDKVTWVYYDYIFVKDNKYYYFCYLNDDMLKRYEGLDIIKLNDREYQKINKGSNYDYKYKVITMINEIIEK